MTPVELIALHGCSRPEEGRGCSVCLAAAEVHMRAVEDAGLAVVSAIAHEGLICVAEYVSRGRGYIGVEPYPDTTARMALGALPERTDHA